MKFWFEIGTAVVMTAVAIWQWGQIRRHPGDAALRVLAVGVTTIAVVLISSIELPPFEQLNALFHQITFTNIAWTLLFYCFSVFFLLVKADQDEARGRGIGRRALIEFLIYGAAIAALMVVSFTVDSSFWRNQTPDEVRSIRNLSFYLLVDGYPIVLWVVGTVRAIGFLRLLRHKWARLATVGVVVGMGLMVAGVNVLSIIGVGVKLLTTPETRLPGTRELLNPLRLGGQVLVALSLASAPLVSLVVQGKERRTRVSKRRAARELEPLWRQLMIEFPQVQLPANIGRGGLLDLDRMMIEVSDGLAYLAPWAPIDGDGATPAAQIASAFAAKRRASSPNWVRSSAPDVEQELPQWEPDFGRGDWRGRAVWMIALTGELRRSETFDQVVVSPSVNGGIS